jgi:tRNA(Ile)-lysidine synthase
MTYERVKSVLSSECRLRDERLVLVGVSGGPDSICLLDVLRRCGYPLVIVHLDHALRPESVDDAQAVLEIAAQMGIDVIVERRDVAAFADVHCLSIEEAARNVRYDFLFQQAQMLNAQAVAVGHNADDQVETVLMHLMRGAGLSGLKGMAYHSLPNAWSRDMPLVRPLLGIWRDEILSYLEERNLRSVLDASNQDIKYYRNRIRHELIPYLETYNPQVKRLLWRTALTLADDYSVMNELVEDAWSASLLQEGDEYLAFDAEVLRDFQDGVKRHLFRRAIYELRPNLRDIDFNAIEHVMDFLEHPTATRQRDLLSGLRLMLDGERLWLSDWKAELPGMEWPQLPEGNIFYLPVPGMLRLPSGWVLRVEPVEDQGLAIARARGNPDAYRAWLDGDGLQFPLQVRTRKPGDRILPLGMGGHSTKLADLMVNEKIPLRARNRWPLVVSGEQIVWVPGVRMSHQFRVRDETESVIYFHLSKSK